MPDDTNNFYETHDHSPFHLLSRLQQTARNIPASIAQKAISSFTLHDEPLPAEATLTVNLLVYPQNPLIGEPEMRTLPREDVQEGLVNSRVKIEDSRGITVTPDDRGNYLYWSDKPEFDLVNAFYYVTFTLRMFERYARRAIPWSFATPRITVDPHVGTMANAFYNEQAHLLGFHTYKTADGKEVSTTQSADIVSHETAHAVLDGLRDLWNESFGLGCRAIHESFGDITAVLVALHDDSLIRRVLEWTKNDLHVTNFVSEVAENLSQAAQDGNVDPLEHTLYLRNAINNFKMIPFDDLKYIVDDPEFTLSRQEHNFSRVLTGAFYDVLVGIYDQLKHNDAPFVAVHKARVIAGQLLVMAIEVSPVGELDYSDMARAFLTADDMLFQGAYRTILRNVFVQRNILSATACDNHLSDLMALPDLSLPSTINNSLAASMYLENTLAPVLKLNFTEEMLPLSTHRNADGYGFMTFYSVKQIKLSGEAYQGYDNASVDIFGSLTVAFDPQDKLRSVVYRAVSDEDVRQIKLCVQDMIANDRISNRIYPLETTPRPSPKGLFIRDSDGEPSPSKLVKYPTTFDSIPPSIRTFSEYLTLWRNKDIRNG